MDEDNDSLSSITNTNMDNAFDDGDFGDFQTGGDPVPKNHIENDQLKPLTIQVDLYRENVFELDWFQFKTFRSNFEELIMDYFISKNNYQFDESNIVIRSQEDQINDCV